MAEAIAIDASLVVRLLVWDDKAQAEAATDLFRAAQAGKFRLVIPTSVVQETVHVLEKIYDLAPDVIAPKLTSLLILPYVEVPDSQWVIKALDFYRDKNSDFGDALLCSFAQSEGYGISTFDKGLIKKFPEVAACTPREWLAEKDEN